MPRARLLVFDDFVHGTNPVYSSAFFNLALGEMECIALEAEVQAYADLSSVTVQVETSADGLSWKPKNGAADISQGSVAQGYPAVLFGSDTGAVIAAAMARVKITLGGAAPSAYVRVWATASPRIADVPPRLPGCLLWLRSDLGITLATGTSNVSAWADQSGNGNHAAQATGARQPAWTPGSINGIPTLNFDGTAQYMPTSAFTLGVYTVAMVCTGQNGTNGMFWIRSTGSTGVDTLYGSTNCTIYCTRSATSCRDLSVGWGQWGATTAKVLVVQMDGTQAGHTLRINGVSQTLSNNIAGDPGTSTNSYKLCVAARDDLTLFAKTNVAEVAVYNSALPLVQVQILEEYARRRYKLY